MIMIIQVNWPAFSLDRVDYYYDFYQVLLFYSQEPASLNWRGKKGERGYEVESARREEEDDRWLDWAKNRRRRRKAKSWPHNSLLQSLSGLI